MGYLKITEPYRTKYKKALSWGLQPTKIHVIDSWFLGGRTLINYIKPWQLPTVGAYSFL